MSDKYVYAYRQNGVCRSSVSLLIFLEVVILKIWCYATSVTSHDCVLFPQLSMEKVQAMAEQVEIKAKVVQTEVKALVLRHKKALEERECELLWKVSGNFHVHQRPISYTGQCLFLLMKYPVGSRTLR